MKLSDTYNLQVVNPDLAKEWHPTKNEDLNPEDVTSGSNKKVWWLCNEGHEWEAQINSRNSGRGCPYCSGRRKLTSKMKGSNLRLTHTLSNPHYRPAQAALSSLSRIHLVSWR